MLLWICVLIIALLILTYNCSRLMKGIDLPLGKKYTYTNIEEKIVETTKKYMEDQYQNKLDLGTLVISTENLLKYSYLEEKDLITSKNDSCKGYSLITNENKELKVISYIKCEKYETEEYQGWRIGE